MNAYCAFAPCGRIFYIDPARPVQRFCSPTCKGRENYRLTLERRAAGVIPPRKSRALPHAPRACRLEACGAPMPERSIATARYCSPRCRDTARLAYRKGRKATDWETYRAARPIPTPAPAPKPVSLLPRIAQPCEGCKHMRLNPDAWRGVECAGALFTACNPLAPAGPQRKEAM